MAKILVTIQGLRSQQGPVDSSGGLVLEVKDDGSQVRFTVSNHELGLTRSLPSLSSGFCKNGSIWCDPGADSGYQVYVFGQPDRLYRYDSMTGTWNICASLPHCWRLDPIAAIKKPIVIGGTVFFFSWEERFVSETSDLQGIKLGVGIYDIRNGSFKHDVWASAGKIDATGPKYIVKLSESEYGIVAYHETQRELGVWRRDKKTGNARMEWPAESPGPEIEFSEWTTAGPTAVGWTWSGKFNLLFDVRNLRWSYDRYNLHWKPNTHIDQALYMTFSTESP